MNAKNSQDGHVGGVGYNFTIESHKKASKKSQAALPKKRLSLTQKAVGNQEMRVSAFSHKV